MAEKRLTKEEAHALYDTMHKAMQDRLGRGVQPESRKSSGMKASDSEASSVSTSATQASGKAKYQKAHSSQGTSPGSRGLNEMRRERRWPNPLASRSMPGGHGAALLVVAVLCCIKVSLSALEASGIARIEQAQAVVARMPVAGQWSKEEVKILTALDARRVELEERSNRLEKRENDFSAKERALAIRLAELKDLTERLKLEREKGDKQKNAQLDQLANVYGSMNPPEAAHLLEQLDIMVALSLVERMPEKRMAQILALMNAQRALELTNLLSNRVR